MSAQRPHSGPPAGATPVIEPAATTTTAFLGLAPTGPVGRPVPLTDFSEFGKQFGGLWEQSGLGFAVAAFFENGGRQAIVVRVEGLSWAQLEAGLVGLDTESWQLLCIPPGLGPRTAGLDAVVVRSVAAFCAKRGTFYVVDADPGWGDPRSAVTGRADLGDQTNAAVYFPWVVTGSGSTARRIPPSGAVAGVYARTDRRSGVWSTPAGPDARLRNVSALATAIDDVEQQALSRVGINALRDVSGLGPVVWGARTLTSDPEWKYVSTRRLTLFLQTSLETGTRWAVFEPHDEPLWRSVAASVEQFMEGLWRRGALQGVKAGDAYFVRCGRQTMNQADIDAGRLLVEIGFAPLRPAEFVVLRVTHSMRSGGRP